MRGPVRAMSPVKYLERCDGKGETQSARSSRHRGWFRVCSTHLVYTYGGGNNQQTRREEETGTAPSSTVISPITRPSSLSGSSVLGTIEKSVHTILEAISGSNPRVPLALLSLASALMRSTSDCFRGWWRRRSIRGCPFGLGEEWC